VEQIDGAIAGQWCDKQVSVATDTDATIEDAVFFMWSVPRLHNEDQLDKPVGGRSWWLAVLHCY
jgi:hypothetical protein